ncbi:cytochrome P450 4A25-like [Ylistrum balloti]|uniref:cytochrome P450 4A25-like n=1 Tax=Ylistrum balloti TaxID=509963 RepID=UPI002905D649|nr:cytochrome P450 4A25-like [Ylistrum balloti]
MAVIEVSVTSLGIQLIYVIAGVFSIVKALTLWSSYRSMKKRYDEIPGFEDKDYHWLMGNIHKFPSDTEGRLQLHRGLMMKNPRVCRMWLGPFVPNIFVHHPDSVKLILKSSEPKARGLAGSYEYLLPWLGEGLLVSNGDRWARSRRLLTPAFHFDILRPYVGIYNEASTLLLNKMADHVKDGKSLELFSNVSMCTLDIILRCAFSYENDCQIKGNTHPYVKAVNELSQTILNRTRMPLLHPDFIFHLTSEGRRFRRNCDFVHTVTEEIITKRKQALKEMESSPKNRYLDFLDILLSAKDESGNGLSDAEIRDEADTFLFEGHDTTASAITWTLYALASNPFHQTKIQQEIDDVTKGRSCEDIQWEDLSKLQYLAQCIKEGMRLYTPVPFIQRRLTKDIKMQDCTLPNGALITLHLYNLHHNPHVWADPDVYDPNRFQHGAARELDTYSFVPFSAGSRNCIGQHFAMNEEKTVIARILQRYTLSTDCEHKVQKKLSAVLRAEQGVHVILKPRKITTGQQ